MSRRAGNRGIPWRGEFRCLRSADRKVVAIADHPDERKPRARQNVIFRLVLQDHNFEGELIQCTSF